MKRSNSGRVRLMYGAAVMALAMPLAAHAEATNFNIAAQSLTGALKEFGLQSRYTVVAQPDVVSSKVTRGVSQSAEPEIALAALLQGTGLDYRRDGDTFLIVKADTGPQSGSAAGGGAEVEALIVTAQKREENIQDVPIAISAFTQKDLEEQKIEGGFDLLKAIPNVTFSKNNFTSYNFSIRGIGTKAVSATTDPGVAVSFNNVALLQNRLFEQEYFDIERVEVLRGPQGTLYGRNATAGVINVISAQPDMNDFKGSLKGEVGNYESKRLVGMINMPIVDDKLAVRLAGSWTQREGYDFNELTNHPVNGRDLWSARMTVAFEPTESIRSNLIWEHFEEDDNRSRTGKQLCHRDPGPTDLAGDPLHPGTGTIAEYAKVLRGALFSQGCKPGNMYDDSAFGTPNGLALPFVFGILATQNDCNGACGSLFPVGFTPDTLAAVSLLDLVDPYLSTTQSHDLRAISSIRDPRYQAKADVFQLNFEIDLGDALTFYSQSVYNKDQVYSFQDFNRFNTQPIFNDTSDLVYVPWLHNGVSPWQNLAPRPEGSPVGTKGVFCDPQLGCSDRMAGFDISQGKAQQFTQEVRLQSNFDGPLNFSAGANYTRFNVLVDYYVFYNLITALALMEPFNRSPDGSSEFVSIETCGIGNDWFFSQTIVPSTDPLAACPYIDPNPIESINGDGHNYFRSKNPYKLKSAAAFGELYWQFNDALKVTAGVRYTDDKKTFIPVPSQVLLAPAMIAGGNVNKGYPELPPIEQHWGEWTGRLGVDWKPELSFTDDTMIYAFYSRGYKGGGANPPSPGFATEADYYVQGALYGVPEEEITRLIEEGTLPVLQLTAVEYERTFKPEFVNAFEVGAKNTLMGGALTFNTGAFYYDYKDYQVSQIRDRTAVNENFDATVWGLEFETRFVPSRNFQLIGNLGYLDTKIGDGMESIDIMDRTAGNADWIVTKPWAQLPSNCIIPMPVAQYWAETQSAPLAAYWDLCGGAGGIFNWLSMGSPPIIDPETEEPYDPLYYNGENGTIDIHGGAGIAKKLGGNELPNSPHWTANIGAQYTIDQDAWKVTFRGDAYWQSQSWARVYNSDPYDKLHGWYNLNLSVWLEIPDQGLKAEFYVKNALDKTPITDSFLNSDDTALTTNVFVLDPRLIGLSVRKEF
jgi:iron complex outermembrane receptor protein